MARPQPLEPGRKTPDFTYEKDGETISSDQLGAPHLIYFYPKDDTPGCTREACAIRDIWSEFEAAGLQVVGVSKDSMASHTKFQTKHRLPFPLISDEDFTLAKAFGVFGEKKFMGKIYDGVHRMSFLVAADGTILKTYPKVKPDAHAKEVIEDLSLLNT
ncbi:thioredoxin-dependent thiol peroxidase [Coraliomargarita parva]|uniref:thioredoxin-dependent thiol peroxidase n=1 Tax=Coraliomargarita parva TaxID=3014050 RepID=UPI0022B385D7|nr:thioredoxin-dependent thiol peroxidase [Coraliomargarita parva]